jgi:hypothetical protein
MPERRSSSATTTEFRGFIGLAQWIGVGARRQRGSIFSPIQDRADPAKLRQCPASAASYDSGSWRLRASSHPLLRDLFASVKNGLNFATNPVGSCSIIQLKQLLFLLYQRQTARFPQAKVSTPPQLPTSESLVFEFLHGTRQHCKKPASAVPMTNDRIRSFEG